MDARLFEHAGGQLVAVAVPVDDFPDSRVDEHLETDAAGVVRTVKRCPLDAHPVNGGLDDRVLLGVKPPAKLVALAGGDFHLFPQTAHLQAVPEPARGPVVARGEKALFLHEDGPHSTPQARGAASDEAHDVHEVLVPAGTGDALPSCFYLCLFTGHGSPVTGHCLFSPSRYGPHTA